MNPWASFPVRLAVRHQSVNDLYCTFLGNKLVGTSPRLPGHVGCSSTLRPNAHPGSTDSHSGSQDSVCGTQRSSCNGAVCGYTGTRLLISTVCRGPSHLYFSILYFGITCRLAPSRCPSVWWELVVDENIHSAIIWFTPPWCPESPYIQWTVDSIAICFNTQNVLIQLHYLVIICVQSGIYSGSPLTRNTFSLWKRLLFPA